MTREQRAPRPAWVRPAVVCVAVALAAASLLYMVRALRDSAAAWREVAWSAHPGLLVAGLVLTGATLSAGCLLWWVVLDRLSPGAIGPGTHWQVWTLTNPTRFLPGRVLHVATLAATLDAVGVPVATMLTSMAIHMWLFVLATAAIASLLLPTGSAVTAMRVGVPVLAALCAIVATHPSVIRLFTLLLTRLTRNPAAEWRAPWSTTLALLAGHAAVQVSTGIASALLLRATVGLDAAQVPHVIGATAAAFLAGYFSFVPAGLGVRDAVMTALLAPSAGPAAAAGSIMLRAASTLVELLLALAGFVLWRSSRRQRVDTGA